MPAKKAAKAAGKKAAQAAGKKAAKTPAKKAAPAKAATKPAKAAAKPATAARMTPGAAEKKYGPRADLGKSIDTFFDKQPGPLRAILVALRELVESVAPEATSSIKWGMPFYQINGEMFTALGAHKAHVNLILAGPPDAFKDPAGRLTGEGKTGRHLKLADVSEVKPAEIRGWLETAAQIARSR